MLLMEQIPQESGWRGSPEVWLEAAYEALLESGVDSVRILPLARRLSLSRTSFYWFFKDREEILAALLTRWREKNTGNLVKQSEAYAESIAEAVMNIMDCWFDSSLFDSQFEFAVRSWGLQSADVMQEVHDADQTRLLAITKMFQRYDFDDVSADVRARTFYLTQIGYITMQSKEGIEVRMKRISAYVETFTGHAPRQQELERFFARHAFPGV